MSDKQIAEFDKALVRIGTLMRWQFALVSFTAAGALWGARLEHRTDSAIEIGLINRDEIHTLRNNVGILQTDSAVIQSKLHGISTAVGKLPGRVAQQVAPASSQE